MKPHTEEIKRILDYSENPVADLDGYITNKMNRLNKEWLLVSVIIIVSTICLIRPEHPSRQEILKAARPVVDSMKVAYQNRLDVITDSLNYGQ